MTAKAINKLKHGATYIVKVTTRIKHVTWTAGHSGAAYTFWSKSRESKVTLVADYSEATYIVKVTWIKHVILTTDYREWMKITTSFSLGQKSRSDYAA